MSEEPLPKYIPCSSCDAYRAVGDFENALACRDCKGKGCVRSPASYTCNMCGGSLCPEEGHPIERAHPHGLVEVAVGGGYSSLYLSDMTTYRFSLCEKCLRTMFRAFKVPPALSDSMGREGHTWEEDDEWIYRYVWMRQGGQERKFPTGTCTYDEACSNKANSQNT